MIMANTGALSTGLGGGTQTTTQDPQNSTQASSLGQSQNVQTGTAVSLLDSHTGIPLNNTIVPTVSLSTGTPHTAPPMPPATSHHGLNPVLLGLSLLLFVVAVALFWATSRPSPAPEPT